MKNACIFGLWLFIVSFETKITAQEVDNTASYRNIDAHSYIRVYSDNDYFTHTDEQYTVGVNVEMCGAWVRKFPLAMLLVHPRFADIRYGIALEQSMYTPYDLSRVELPFGDRPFAATLFIKTFLIATDFENKQRFTSTLSTGVIGPWAQGDDLQHVAHVILNDVVPPGWKYQVQNDAILNYQVNYQKQLIHAGTICSFDVEAMARGGTLSDVFGLSCNFLIGYFESAFARDNMQHAGNFNVYVYCHPEVDFVGYDAILEGGVFKHSSPYTISANKVSRVDYQSRVGIVVDFKRFRLEYNECFESPEFSGGPNHAFGGIGVGMILDKKNTLQSADK